MGCEFWIKTFSIEIIKSENLDLKLNIYYIWTEKKLSGTERNYNQLQSIKHQQNNRGVQSCKTEPFKTVLSRNRKNSLIW